MSTDESEQNDLYHQRTELGIRMKQRLDEWLAKQQVKYPVRDPLFNAMKYQQKLLEYREKLMPRLEKQRKAMLGIDWEPNKDWWGSQNIME